MKVTLAVIAVLLSPLCIGNAVVQGYAPPRITSTESDDELIFESSNTIVIECEATKPVEWTYPVLSHHFNIESNPESEIHERANSTTRYISGATDGYVYRSSLEVQDAHYLDTGYFTCHHAGTDPEDQREAARVYVYVEDQEHLLVVRDDEDVITVFAHQSKREVIPCKPTHPRIRVSFEDTPEETNNNEARELEFWSYDPHEGFIIDEAELAMQGDYYCLAVNPVTNKTQKLPVYLQVQPATASAPKPHIDSSNATYVVNNKTFMLNCSAHFDLGTTIEMTWQVPAGVIDGQRITVGGLTAYNHLIGSTEKKVAHLELTVRNVSKEDEGFYSCQARDHTGKSESASTFVTVHDGNISYVNISNDGLSFEIERNANESVKWIVHFLAFPSHEVNWYKSGLLLSDDAQLRIVVKKEQTMTSLEVRNVTAAESGLYELVIKTSTQLQDSRNFTLKVKDKPSVTAPKVVTVKRGGYFNFKCDIASYPQSEVKVLFRPCLPQTKCKDNWIYLFSSNKSDVYKASQKQNGEIIWHNADVTMVNVTGTAREVGHYRCEACNSLGCSEDVNKSRSFISLEVNELGVDPSSIELTQSAKRAPVAGEEFSISCAVSLYRFKPILKWKRTLSTGAVPWFDLNSSGNDFRMSSHKTNYSYTETLTWTQISQSANGGYECLALYLSNKNVSSTMTLKVEVGEAPRITNKSDEIVSVSQFDELNLFCDATGTPLPKVEWFKDTIPIGETDGKWTKEDDNTQRRSTLLVTYAKTADSGTYTCKFTNINGTDKVDFLVNVRDQPMSAGILSGITIVSIVVVVLLGLLIHKIRQDQKRKAFFHAHQLDMFDKGNPESINPDLPVDEQTELLPYDRKWEFPSDKLKLGKQLGAGAFGRVVKADAIGILNSEPITTVAVKMVRSQGNMLGLKALMSELKIMVHMGSHLNVVNLLGACTKNIAKGELLVIVEYCRYGNIQNYLIKHRSSFINEVDHRGMVVASPEGLIGAESQLTVGTPRSPKHFDTADYNGAHAVATDVTFLPDSRDVTIQMEINEAFDSGGKQSLTSSPSKASDNGTQAPWRSNYRGDYRDEPEKPICTRDLICWAFQIARGMEYLARRKILHGDLAARNVLLADNNIVKIADFGLAREVYRSGNYKKKGEGPLPVKWMAIESILDRVFSTQSDVWSFGIVLWELFSLGKTPYPGMEADEYFFKKIKQGYRMDQPKYAPSSIGVVMRECWLHDPVARPSFTDLADRLGMLLEASVRSHYVKLNEEYDRLNANAGSDYLGMMAAVDYVNVGSRTPVPERRQYVNIPQNDDSTRESEYLPMERMSPKVIFDERTDGQEGSYLFMSSPITTPQRTPINTESPGEHRFDFNFAPKLRKSEETIADGVELRPILRSSENQSPNIEQTSPAKLNVNGFSNPNYRNPPVIRYSDSEDQPTEHYTMPRVLSLNSDPRNYINVTDHSTEPVEPHYVQPKSHVRAA